MNYSKCRWLVIILIFKIGFVAVHAQTAWPSKTWANATNLSAVLPTSVVEMSGLYWNNELKRLLTVGDAGYFTALQYNSTTKQFTLLGSVKNSDGPEGITQVNTSGNEFYTIDENSYEIRKYTFNTGFTSVTKLKSWNLLISPSPMTNTDNTGPEGIAFVPDSYLQKTAFVSSVSGQVYTSTKGMGGLLFLAHQNGGYVWVYDVNPNVSNDFLFVGKYKTNRSESCDLAFDNSTGLMYILHNIDDNYLEATDLKSSLYFGEYKLNIVNEYLIPNPSGTANVEGFTLSPKYPQENALGAWLCRDVTKSSEVADALRWFTPFAADGTNLQTGILQLQANTNQNFRLFKKNNSIILEEQNSSNNCYDIYIYNLQGSVISTSKNVNLAYHFNINHFNPGVYLVKIADKNRQSALLKFTKNPDF